MAALIRLVLLPVLALSMVAIGATAGRAAYPDRPIRLVVPFPAGGPDDVVARAIAPKLAARLGQKVEIDYVPGRDGVRGTELVAKARPDGYTLLLTPSSFAIHPGTYGKLPYDTETAFAAVSLLLAAQYVLVVNPSLPVDSVDDLIGYARSHPGRLHYAAAGAGGPTELGFELFKIAAGIDVVENRYEGGQAALAAVAANQAQMMLAPLIAAVPMMHEGKVRGLAVSGSRPSAVLPDLPSIAQTLPGFTAVTWFGVLAPAGTPPAIIDQLSAACDEILDDPQVAARFASIGGEPVGGSPAVLADLIHAEIRRWIGVAKEAGIRVN